MKRSLKNFTEERWNTILQRKNWANLNEDETQLSKQDTLDNKVRQFTKNIEEALDEIAPMKTFAIKSQYKFGLSQETKDLMKKRDQLRKNLSTASHSEKSIILTQYKKIRNVINNKIKWKTSNMQG